MAISLLTLALVGTLSFLFTIVMGYEVPAGVTVGRHFLIGLVSTLLLVMAHSFIMFFLIATGVELKNMEKEHGWGDDFRRRTIAMKGKVFGPATMALLLVIAHFVLGAAAHTRAIPMWMHHVLAWVTFAVSTLALWREYWALGENNRLIDEAGRRRAPISPPR
jgi:hypothetical protein